MRLKLCSTAGIPADAAAVVLNMTAVGHTTQGWITAYPAGQPVPATSSLNFDPSDYAVANGLIVRTGTAGQVCVEVGTVNSLPGSSEVVLDVTAYVSAANATQLPMLSSPQRVADTRATANGPIPAGQTRCFTVAGQAGVPANASAVILNVTAVGYVMPGWLTAYPAGLALPATSTLNFDQREYALANEAIVGIGANGQVCVAVGSVNGASGSSHVVLDVVGYLNKSGATATRQ